MRFADLCDDWNSAWLRVRHLARCSSRLKPAPLQCLRFTDAETLGWAATAHAALKTATALAQRTDADLPASQSCVPTGGGPAAGLSVARSPNVTAPMLSIT